MQTEPLVFRGKAGQRQFTALTQIGDNWHVAYTTTSKGDKIELCTLNEWRVFCDSRGKDLPLVGTTVLTKKGKTLEVVDYPDGDGEQKVCVAVKEVWTVEKLLRVSNGSVALAEVDEEDALNLVGDPVEEL